MEFYYNPCQKLPLIAVALFNLCGKILWLTVLPANLRLECTKSYVNLLIIIIIISSHWFSQSFIDSSRVNRRGCFTLCCLTAEVHSEMTDYSHFYTQTLVEISFGAILQRKLSPLSN